MKSERRHELEHNELADWTVHIIEKVKPYTNVIVGGAIAIVILAVGIGLYVRTDRIESESAWTMYYDALSVDSDLAVSAMQEVAAKFPKTEAAQWATVCEGDFHLCNGCEELFVDKAHANQELKKAIECYQKTLAFGNPLLDERATFGLARAYESQGDSDSLEKAKKTYEEQLKKWKDGIFASVAKSRLEDLGKESTKEFYDRFVDYRPQPKKEPTPSTAIPDFNELDLPKLPPMGPSGMTDEPGTNEPMTEPMTEPTTGEPGTNVPQADKPNTEKPEPEKEPETTGTPE